ncbi:MAG TPA: N-acetylneuraminate synthase family protein, partial [Solirubrobacteraceae bacterium]|nr:N-acetylneuraminate synthase family protein [Solirubrobacteraceae bacterium]
MTLPREFAIGERMVGPGHPCYVIAEAGANHNKDLDVARRLIDVAADAGADAVKFQTYSGALYSTKTPGFKYLEPTTDLSPSELLEDIALPREWQGELAAYAAERRIDF